MGVRRCQSAYEAPSDETPTVSIWFPRQPEWRQEGRVGKGWRQAKGVMAALDKRGQVR